MARPLRTFVALELPRSLADELADRAAALAEHDPALAVPAAEHMHLTLAFLGDTWIEDVHRIAKALERAAADTPPIPVSCPGLGAFPDAARARVVHAPVLDLSGADILAGLHERIGLELEELGFPRERRRWQPHVTLGRLRGRPAAATVEAVRAAPSTPHDQGPEAILSLLALISSDPASREYRYKNLTTIHLGDEGEDT
ncbi:MAG: RNA 2',3'-cyclic phosphodiesterase [Planctomycetota bacterium]